MKRDFCYEFLKRCPEICVKIKEVWHNTWRCHLAFVFTWCRHFDDTHARKFVYSNSHFASHVTIVSQLSFHAIVTLLFGHIKETYFQKTLLTRWTPYTIQDSSRGFLSCDAV